jgi:hypothetical protein
VRPGSTLAGVDTVTRQQLDGQLDFLRAAPADAGTLAMLVRRPDDGARELLAEGVLDEADGLLGDNWLARATRRAVESGRHLDAQLNVMSARMVSLLAGTDEERALAGDQLYVDLDISVGNLPTGARLAVGDTAVVEVTAKPHNGCRKFLDRFGADAVEFVNSGVGKELRLRGLNARVVRGGTVRPGDPVRVESR